MPGPRCLALFALLCACGAAQASVHVDCRSPHTGPCPAPPAQPAPPAAPMPPAPPAPHQEALAHVPALPAAPAAPALPALPAPPAPPALPDVPDALHAACAGKKPGARLSRTIAPGETMSGLCVRSDGKMVFRLRSYRKQD